MGNRRRQYLKQHHRIKYYNVLTHCALYSHLADVEKQAQDMFDRLVSEMAKCEGITEWLKTANQMEWIRRMTNIRERATKL